MYLLYHIIFKNPSFLNKKALQQKPKGWKLQAPLTFSSWKQIIKDMRNIYKLREVINIFVNTINPV